MKENDTSDEKSEAVSKNQKNSFSRIERSQGGNE
jgi:hypothetical protein